MAFGSAIHRRSSCKRAPIGSVKTPNTRHLGETYPKRTVPTNDVPELLEEPLLRPANFFSHEIPLVSLNDLVFSATDPPEEGERIEVGPLGTYQKSRTGLPALVHR